MHTDPAFGVILSVTFLYFIGLIGRYIAQKMNQPGVLGELCVGVICGNLLCWMRFKLAYILREGTAMYDVTQYLLNGKSLHEAVVLSVPAESVHSILSALSGPEGLDFLKITYVTDIFSRYGVVLLLFMVGLESSLKELKQSGKESLRVACIGVLAPIILGYLVICWLLPLAEFKTHLFVAATLCATSAGITARVFKDLNLLKTREAKTILGSAVIDDVLGLIILGIVSGIVVRGGLHLQDVLNVFIGSFFFFMGSIYIGPWVLKRAVIFFRFLDPWEMKLAVSFLFMMLLASLASLVQLASIIGAFVAGLLIQEKHFSEHENRLTIHHLVAPIEAILAPLFFVLIGIQVKLELFFHWHVLVLALGLLIAAVLGKLVSGMGAGKHTNRWLIGIGMLPRGEVGLVFASIGKTLGVIPDDVFSAIICMVIVTTFMSPPLLKAVYQKELSTKGS